MGKKLSPQSKGTLFYVDLPIDNVRPVTSSPNDSKFTIECDRITKISQTWVLMKKQMGFFEKKNEFFQDR